MKTAEVRVLEELIRRINELAAKNKAEGLTEEELAEREILRKRYRQSVIGNLKLQLNNTYVKDEQGNITPLSGNQKN